MTGTIVNSEGQGLEGIGVETETFVGVFFIGSPDLERINGTTTNAEGEFSFTSLDVDADKLLVQIAPDDPQRDFQSLTYIDSRTSREETLLDLGRIILKRRVDVTIVFNIEEPIGIDSTYPNPDPVIAVSNWKDMEELPEEPEHSRLLERYTWIEADEDGLYRLRLETLENSEIVLTYLVDGITTESTILISGEEENPYEFTP